MVIQRVLDWWRASRAWKAEHRATWPAYTALTDGKSRLLVETEVAIQRAAHAAGFVISDREEGWMPSVYSGQEVYVRFKLAPSSVEVWLHSDCASIEYSAFEEWDFRTPADFITEVSAEALKRAAETRAVV